MPVTLPLGGKEPATLEGRFDASGYTLQLTGSVVAEDLMALGNAIPAFGDGLKPRLDEMDANPSANPRDDPPGNPPSGSDPLPAAPLHPLQVDLTATRAWGGHQLWSDLATHPPVRRRAHSPGR
jgi:AsmA protein